MEWGLVIFFNYDEHNQNDWQDQICVLKHGSPDARFKNIS